LFLGRDVLLYETIADILEEEQQRWWKLEQLEESDGKEKVYFSPSTCAVSERVRSLAALGGNAVSVKLQKERSDENTFGNRWF
jgi:hypothetical protein